MIDLSRETETLARRLAEAQSMSIDAAVWEALKARAEAAGIAQVAYRPRDVSPEAVAARRLRMDPIARDIASMPVLDPRPIEDIVEDLNSL